MILPWSALMVKRSKSKTKNSNIGGIIMPNENYETEQLMSDDVNFYIMGFESKVQERLMVIRFMALDIFQNVEEKIYHSVPTLFMGGKNIMCYGAYKNHISIHLGYDWKNDWETRANNIMDFLKENYPQYRYTKFTIQLPHKLPFPNELIQEICEMLWNDRV